MAFIGLEVFYRLLPLSCLKRFQYTDINGLEQDCSRFLRYLRDGDTAVLL